MVLMYTHVPTKASEKKIRGKVEEDLVAFKK